MSGDAQDRRVSDAEHAMDDTLRELEEHRDHLSEDIEHARGSSRQIHEAQQVPGFRGDWAAWDRDERDEPSRGGTPGA